MHKTIRDAVHGDMKFDDAEISVIDTDVVQRLRWIKQLGTASLVYPCATHSRFAHSLGTCHLTGKLLDILISKGAPIVEEEVLAVRIASLLHDITHIPFGHTFEDERRLFVRHDQNQDRLSYFLHQPTLSDALQKSGVGDLVEELLQPESKAPAFLRQIFSGTVCSDLLDYLKRDAYFCGLNLDYDLRIFDSFELAENTLAMNIQKSGRYRHDTVSELIHLLSMRYTLTERVYYHHAKTVTGAMVSLAVELAIENGFLNLEDLYVLGDESLLQKLNGLGAKNPAINETISDILSRRLYRRVYLLSAGVFENSDESDSLSFGDCEELANRFHFDIAARRQMEHQIADALGIPYWHVIVYCPSPKMSLKEADVPVLSHTGSIRTLSSLGHPDIESLNRKYRSLWKMEVFIKRSTPDLSLKAGKICEESFGFENRLNRLRTGQLTFQFGEQ